MSAIQELIKAAKQARNALDCSGQGSWVCDSAFVALEAAIARAEKVTEPTPATPAETVNERRLEVALRSADTLRRVVCLFNCEGYPYKEEVADALALPITKEAIDHSLSIAAGKK